MSMTCGDCYPARKYHKYLALTFLIAIFITPGWPCRLWGVLATEGYTLYNPETTDISFLYQELYLLQQQGGAPSNPWPYNNDDGWGIAYYFQPGLHMQLNATRSALPAATDSELFDHTLTSLFSSANNSKFALGHVRRASSGAIEIPDPHPFVFQSDLKSYTFIHNGNVDKLTLLDLLTNDGTDYSWLDQHPPQTYGYGDWHTSGWDYVVDSELLFFWIVQSIQLNENDVLTGMEVALSLLESLRPNDKKNFIFSDGEDIYAYQSSTLGYSDLFYMEPSDSVFHYAIMSSPPDTGLAGEAEWMPIPDRAIVRFSPSEPVTADHIILSGLPSGFTDFLPVSINLFNYPNPFNSNTNISFTLFSSAHIWLTLTDLNGKRIQTLSNGKMMSPGKYDFIWNGLDMSGNSVSSGIYFIRFQSDDISETRKMILMK